MIMQDQRTYLIHIYSTVTGEYIGDVIASKWYVKTINNSGVALAEVGRIIRNGSN